MGSKTDVVLVRTMITDSAENSEILARFIDFSMDGIDHALQQVADATDGLPLLDSLLGGSLFVSQYIAAGRAYMAPAHAPAFELLSTETITVELVTGITEYSRMQIFNACLITFVKGDKHVVVDALNLRSYMASPSDMRKDSTLTFRSRQGYIERAASVMLHEQEMT